MIGTMPVFLQENVQQFNWFIAKKALKKRCVYAPKRVSYYVHTAWISHCLSVPQVSRQQGGAWFWRTKFDLSSVRIDFKLTFSRNSSTTEAFYDVFHVLQCVLKVWAPTNHLAFFALVGWGLETRIHPLRPFVSFPLDVCWLESCVLDLESFASVLFFCFLFFSGKKMINLIVLLSKGFGNRTALFFWE